MRHPRGRTRTTAKFLSMLSVALLAMFTATEADAQQQIQERFGGDAHPGADVLSLNLYGGGFFSASSFAGGAQFEDTGTFGAAATFWATQNLGVRGNVLWYSHALTPGDEDIALIGEDPDVFHYSGDVVLRMPMPAMENVSWFPYILGGIGGKTYDFDTLGTETDFAGNVGLGLEARFGDEGRWGIHTEVRDFISNFDVAGVDETLHDIVWTGGFSINF